MNISATIASHVFVQATAKKKRTKTAAGMASSCEESNRPCKHNTSGKSQKVEVTQREVCTKPVHLDKEIRVHQFLQTNKSYLKAQSVFENSKSTFV